MKPYPKTVFSFSLLAFTYLFFAGASCKKDGPVTPETELAKLPPETQEGKNTFGCLVNGKAFLPKGNFSAGGNATQCFYQYVDGGYYFLVNGSNKSNSVSNNYTYSISINTDSVILKQGGKYILKKTSVKGNSYGRCTLVDLKENYIGYYSTDSNTGELIITFLDDKKQIISGTFFFDAVNDKGEKVEVREGRFDMQYSK